MTGKSTNIEDFTKFLYKIKGKIKLSTNGKPFLVFDNHRTHTSPKMKPLLDEFFIDLR